MKVLRPRVNRRSARLLFCWRDWSRRARLGLSAQLQVYEPRRLGFGSAGDWTDASVPVNGGFGTVCEWEHQVMQLHPIMYVADQYAERSFYELFGLSGCMRARSSPAFWLSGTARRSSGFSGRRLGTRPTRRACGGSSSSIRLTCSNGSSLCAALTVLSMRSSPSGAATGLFAVWSLLFPQVG